jgi:hypothetical protein
MTTNLRSTIAWFELVFLAMTAASDLNGEQSAPARFAKTNLVAILDQPEPQMPPVGKTFELDPQWVGTVKRVYLRDGEGVYKTDKPEDIRFTHLIMKGGRQSNKSAVIARLRQRPNMYLNYDSRYASRYEVPFREELPSVNALGQMTNLYEMEGIFGSQQTGIDAWGDGGRTHWVQGWTFFTRTGQGQLRYLDIFAHVSAPTPDKKGKLPKQAQTNATMDILVIREGIFHPADPSSAEERQRFLTGDEIFAHEQAERAKEREKYPQPLRALIEAKEKPDDSEMAAYLAAINQIRANPNPVLFHQLVAWMNEDEVEFGSYLEDILYFDDPPPGLRAWKKSAHQTAVRAYVEAISEVRNPEVLEKVLLIALELQGGGKLEFSVPGTDAEIDLVAKKESGGYGETYGSDGLTKTNISQVAAYCQEVLKKKYASLWPKR